MFSRRAAGGLVLALLMISAGCASSITPSNSTTESNQSVGQPDGVATPGPSFEDPSADVLGWEGGYWYNESVDIDQSDGLSDKELNAYVARSQARVEHLRQKEFLNPVDVSVISRSEYTSSDNNRGSTQYTKWNNQVWEALFIIGESRSTQEALEATRGASVAGFYDPASDEIKIITDTPETPVIDNRTLVHELVHAVQDQHYNLSSDRFTADTQDGQLATDGLVEGDARFVEKSYVEQCQNEWSCVATPSQSDESSGETPDLNYGLFLTMYQPYSDGPSYIAQLREQGGPSSVDNRFIDPPTASKSIIHNEEYTSPSLSVPDRSSAEWSRFNSIGDGGADSVGEASIYMMFWYQSRQQSTDIVDPAAFSQPKNNYDTYDYSASPSDGWANDKLYPYRTTEDGETQYGYVWRISWESSSEAQEFVTAYREMLSAQEAVTKGSNTYVIKDGDFADAFRIERSGSQVTIINGPTPRSLDDIHSS